MLFVGNPYTHFLASDLLPPDGCSFPILPQAKLSRRFPHSALLLVLVSLRVKRSSLVRSLLVSHICKYGWQWWHSSHPSAVQFARLCWLAGYRIGPASQSAACCCWGSPLLDDDVTESPPAHIVQFGSYCFSSAVKQTSSVCSYFSLRLGFCPHLSVE